MYFSSRTELFKINSKDKGNSSLYSSLAGLFTDISKDKRNNLLYSSTHKEVLKDIM